MYNLLVDIDEVVRDLMYYVPGTTKTWDDGNPIFGIIKKNPELLSIAPVTKYYTTIRDNIPDITFLSCQLMFWRKYTDIWLNTHFKNFKVIYTSTFKEKINYIRNSVFVIEDYPKFDDYSSIILIDYLYNRDVKNPYARIKTPNQLKNILRKTYKI